jgi:hypothetical protein
LDQIRTRRRIKSGAGQAGRDQFEVILERPATPKDSNGEALGRGGERRGGTVRRMRREDSVSEQGGGHMADGDRDGGGRIKGGSRG